MSKMTSNTSLAILDLGIGNLGSWEIFLNTFDFLWRKVTTLEDLDSNDCLVLPGVGSAVEVLALLSKEGIDDQLRNWARSGEKIVGVCLGAQILLGYNEEAREDGVGLVGGGVFRFIESPRFHVGWSVLSGLESLGLGRLAHHCSVPRVYFNHGYEMKISEAEVSTAKATRRDVVALFRKDNIWGLQFHPEKSRRSGAEVFLEILLAE